MFAKSFAIAASAGRAERKKLHLHLLPHLEHGTNRVQLLVRFVHHALADLDVLQGFDAETLQAKVLHRFHEFTPS